MQRVGKVSDISVEHDVVFGHGARLLAPELTGIYTAGPVETNKLMRPSH